MLSSITIDIDSNGWKVVGWINSTPITLHYNSEPNINKVQGDLYRTYERKRRSFK